MLSDKKPAWFSSCCWVVVGGKWQRLEKICFFFFFTFLCAILSWSVIRLWESRALSRLMLWRWKCTQWRQCINEKMQQTCSQMLFKKFPSLSPPAALKEQNQTVKEPESIERKKHMRIHTAVLMDHAYSRFNSTDILKLICMSISSTDHPHSCTRSSLCVDCITFLGERSPGGCWRFPLPTARKQTRSAWAELIWQSDLFQARTPEPHGPHPTLRSAPLLSSPPAHANAHLKQPASR